MAVRLTSAGDDGLREEGEGQSRATFSESSCSSDGQFLIAQPCSAVTGLLRTPALLAAG